MGNTIPIKYHGETLVCVDPSQIMAVEPYIIEKQQRIAFKEKVKMFLNRETYVVDKIHKTKIIFKNGTSIIVPCPFFDFINSYP